MKKCSVCHEELAHKFDCSERFKMDKETRNKIREIDFIYSFWWKDDVIADNSDYELDFDIIEDKA